ncbi:methyltransferase type 11 : Methyltransferase type 11 OS=Pseudonocardia dioxanivorans (strain ATCC 55486 / DSM 44775 / JCM 13855 / CB1190) GN=Psed_1269 PE=4 SV=1: Methyltransf_11 [Gemmataceae bacterium]|nr:methyltransferase type 11 : Methyltransferase type 11 OS=Pseudonocardia dioxanivorans (strain ATCC 55486 / DSM 44775 / JCM 13855 / CB1190) GN=Psed_1269 PE=4 SV=1: Methyltransf_11 [Gemmataceae bacterium]VTT99549.1 methyltransferase type 11 : Methyltransferase type 11 OS=Pseudonocardia dioxanivorans (strain ATCC 55486 / DSM 44775 / JCM 13855 / CB1190) GN=Psed_1269 PE=4 SV=1: Methyltransf_11 [Gemmataceae bacterium]
MPTPTPTEPTTVAACCAAFYEQDWVQTVLGGSFHPGGVDLSARVVRGLHLPAKSRVLDVACGIGATARLMARDFGLDVIGLDASTSNVAKAAMLSVGETAQFVTGDARALPFPDETFDAVVCECAVSTFADQPRVVAEFGRVLKPGGVVGITDMVIEGELPADLTGMIAPWTCLAAARSVLGYQSLFLSAGLRVVEYADESPSLRRLVADLKRKLLVAGLGRSLSAAPGLNDLDIGGLRELLNRAGRLARDGAVQYARLTFAKGRPRFTPPSACCDPSGGCC